MESETRERGIGMASGVAADVVNTIEALIDFNGEN